MIGRMVSHYRIVSHVGSGGMGTVYLAEDTRLHRRVALKFLPQDTPRSAEASARLVREARAASALEHPHIGTIYEIDELDGQPFIAMAYYEGETLAARLARGPLPMADVARIVAQVAEALAAAHAAGIVHRDLKPSNLMLTASGHVKVLDFGIAMFSSADTETLARLTSTGMAVGTAAYMSPEQATGEDVDARSDVWSLGVVAREMLTGRLPFEGSNALAVVHAVLSETPPALRSLRPDVAPELEEVVARTMVRERNARTITASEVPASRGGVPGPALVRYGARRPAAPRRSSRRALVAAVVLTAVALAGTGAWWIQRNAKARWAREQALPQIVQLAGADRFDEAYRLAQRAAAYLPNDPLLAEQLRAISRTANIESVPSGAEVFYRPYGRVNEPWRPLGRTPIANAHVPRGLMHFKAELTGFEVSEDVGPGPFWPPRFRFKLVPAGTAPPGDGPDRVVGPAVSTLHPGPRSPASGHARRLLDRPARGDEPRVQALRRRWRVPAAGVLAGAVHQGRPDARLRRGDGAARRHDGTPGTRHVGAGHVSSGPGRFPGQRRELVRGRSLRTLGGQVASDDLHWSRAADQRLSGDVVPASNFGGKGLLPVGEGGVTRGGTTDMGGNVKEWCWNPAGAKRYILGGAWNEPVYMFTDADAQSPFARQATYGFRCIKPDRPEDLHAAVTGEVALPSRDLRNVPSVSDAVFRGLAERLLVRSREPGRQGRRGGRFLARVAHREGELRGRVW